MTMQHAIAFTLGLTLTVAQLLLPSSAFSAAQKIAVLVSSSEPPFEETLAGFQEYLLKQGIRADYDVHRLSGRADDAAEAIQKIRKNPPRIILALGSLGTEAVTSTATAVPLVSCLVLRSNIFNAVPNATGVELEFPVQTQLTWLKKILPDAKKIGVIYNPKENKRYIEYAAKTAQSMDLQLHAIEARTPQEVPSALTHLRDVDVIWGLPDALTLAPPMAKHMLLFAFRNKIPFVGPSETWVKAGALYSLTWDYRDLGSQCGAMAHRILQGESPSEIPPAYPRKVLYSVNQNTAEQIKVSIPETVLLKAREIY